MWKKFAVLAVSLIVLNACAGPVTTTFDAARQEGLNQTPLSSGACDGIGQLIPSPSLTEQSLTLGIPGSTPLQASAAPSH